MATFHFTFRPSACVGHSGSINLRITHNRQSSTIALPLKVHPHQWDKEKELSNDEAVNKELSNTRAVVERIITILGTQGEYSADEVALRFRCQMKGDNLPEFAEQLSLACDKRGQYRTARAYISTSKRLTAFCKGRVLRLTDITAPLMEEFEKAMQTEGLARNTTSFYMRNLRAIYNKAVEMQTLVRSEQSPFARVFTGTEKTRKRALSQENINTLYNVNVLGNQSLDLARKLFFFGFHACGMSFVDMAYLKKTDVRNGFIHYRRKKTGKMIEVRITKELQELINYFHSKNRNSLYLLPIITDANKDARLQYESALRLQNNRLKALGKLSALDDTITTHVCRHSWASFARTLNIPLGVISESLGHSDEKTTAIYLASFDRSILDKACEEVSSLIKPKQGHPYHFAY